MFGRFTIVLWIAIALAAQPAAGRASDYKKDDLSSQSLTNYLHRHRLPLVGAQVQVDGEGGRQVLLYGFVATAFGRSDAEVKARRYLHEPGLTVINRISINPELRTLRSPRQSSSAPADEANQRSPDLDAYQQQQTQEYLNQNRDPFGPGFSFGFGFGSGGGGFGFGAPLFP